VVPEALLPLLAELLLLVALLRRRRRRRRKRVCLPISPHPIPIFHTDNTYREGRV
jgi:hypothetical protein